MTKAQTTTAKPNIILSLIASFVLLLSLVSPAGAWGFTPCTET